MPIFKTLKGSSSANATIAYCEKGEVMDKETGEKTNKCVLKAGYNCDIEDIREEFAETRNRFNKNGGRQAMHFVLSFDPKELPNTPENQEKCLEIGLALAEKISKGHETGCYVHADQDHLHCHFVTNAVHYESGNKFQMKKIADLVAFRAISDQVCKEYGIEPLKEYQGDQVQEKDAEKRIKALGGVPWKEEIKEAIRYAKTSAVDMESYKELLAEKGIEMYERGEQTKGYIHVGQRDSGAKSYKLRDKNKSLDGGLHLEDVQKAFVKNRQMQNEQPKTAKQGQKFENRTSAAATPSIAPSIPKTDKFDETIQNSQDKKAEIKATSGQNLKEAKSETERAEIKRNEAIKLELAEREKEMQLQKENEVEQIYRDFQKMFPYSTNKKIDHSPDSMSMYFGGNTRKLYKVTYDKTQDTLSAFKRDPEGNYSEQVVKPTKDKGVAEYDIQNIADHEERRAVFERQRQAQLER